MLVDSNLLVGIMLVSAVFHGIAAWWSAYIYLTYEIQLYQVLAIMFILSFIIYSMFLYLLQHTISLYGILLATVCSVGFFTIPILFESARLVVSQVFQSHAEPLTQLTRNQAAIMIAAATAVQNASDVAPNPDSLPLKDATADLLNPAKLKEQTMLEYSSGAAYWTAFSGAYGIVIGSILLNIYTKTS
jgi:hypothetical protein